MSNWLENKKWSDKFLPEIKQILGLHLIGEPLIEDDQKRNTDLIVLKMDPVRIACRMRRNKYLIYKDEFTIRAGLASGAKTELTKIIEGWGDYFFYGISDCDEKFIEHWILGDLKAFRIWFMRKLALSEKEEYPGEKRDNSDGSSFFFAYKYYDIPGFIKAESPKIKAGG